MHLVRRHRRPSIALGALVLVVGASVAWYLGSPVFIRTELVEAAPSALVLTPPPTSTPSAVATPASDATPVADPDPDASPAASDSATPSVAADTSTPTFTAAAIATGRFTGSDDFHFGRGSATIFEVAPGRFHLRLEAFSVRNGPDLYVYLSPDPDGYATGSLELGKLKATDGSFGYDLPAGVDPATFRSAVIWCKQFSHLFATAPLAAA